MYESRELILGGTARPREARFPDSIVFALGIIGAEQRYRIINALKEQKRITSDPYDLRLINRILSRIRNPILELNKDEAELLGFALQSENFRLEAMKHWKKETTRPRNLSDWISKAMSSSGITEEDIKQFREGEPAQFYTEEFK